MEDECLIPDPDRCDVMKSASCASLRTQNDLLALVKIARLLGGLAAGAQKGTDGRGSQTGAAT